MDVAALFAVAAISFCATPCSSSSPPLLKPNYEPHMRQLQYSQPHVQPTPYQPLHPPHMYPPPAHPQMHPQMQQPQIPHQPHHVQPHNAPTHVLQYPQRPFHPYFNPYHTTTPTTTTTTTTTAPTTTTTFRYDYLDNVNLYREYGKQACCLTDLNKTHAVYTDTLLFFDKCPANKTAEVVCDAAAFLFADYGTEFYPTFQTNVTSSLNQASAEFVAPFPADIALTGLDCCYNVFTNVKAGDRLSPTCTNKIIGDDLVNIFSGVNIYTPGDFFNSVPVPTVSTASFDLRVIVGGDWQGRTIANINTKPNSEVGPLSMYALFVGGNVEQVDDDTLLITWMPSTDPFTLTAGVGGTDMSNRVRPHYMSVDAQEVDQVRFQVAAQACALSKSIQDQNSTGTVQVSGDPDGELTFSIVCDNGVVNCVIDFPPDTVQEGGMYVIDFDANDATSIKINVPGEVRAGLITNGVDITAKVVWNFYEAEVIDFTVDPDDSHFEGSILAPRAKKVSIAFGVVNAGAFDGSIIMGHLDSHLEIINMITMPGVPTTCPPGTPTLTMCNCLCPSTPRGYSR